MCQPGACEHSPTPSAAPVDDENATAAPGRRSLLRMGGVLGAAGALTLAPVTFAQAADRPSTAPANGTEVTRVISGHLETGAADFVYLPVEVPKGVNQIAVSYTYDKPSVPAGTPANSCDIGIFDERGTDLGGKGFRGWSGGFRTSFVVNSDTTTPGYLPGPVNPGTWHIVLGPYQVAPQGMDYQVTGDPDVRRARRALRARLPAGAGQGPRPGLVPRRLPPAHRLLRRQATARRGGRRGAGRRAGLHGLHRPQHLLLARGLGPVRGPGPADHHRRGDHHPQRPLAGPGSAGRRAGSTGATARATTPSRGSPARCTGSAVWWCPRTRTAPTSPASGSSASTTPTPSRCGTGRGPTTTSHAVDTWDAKLGEAVRGGRRLAARDGQQRRAQRTPGHRPAAQRRARRRPDHGRDPGRHPGRPHLDRGVLGGLARPSPPPAGAGRRASGRRCGFPPTRRSTCGSGCLRACRTAPCGSSPTRARCTRSRWTPPASAPWSGGPPPHWPRTSAPRSATRWPTARRARATPWAPALQFGAMAGLTNPIVLKRTDG